MGLFGSFVYDIPTSTTVGPWERLMIYTASVSEDDLREYLAELEDLAAAAAARSQAGRDK